MTLDLPPSAPALALPGYRCHRRVALKGWVQEDFYARLELGHALAGGGQTHAAAGAYLDAWQVSECVCVCVCVCV